MQTQLILSDADWAWLAGLFEGEGTIGFNVGASVAVAIAMTDEDVLRTVDRLVPSPGGLRYNARDKRNPRHKPQWSWRLSARDDVRTFLEGILPRLHGRRAARAQDALERLSRNRVWHSGKSHCRNGHLWKEAGIYTSPSGKRHCRMCMRESGDRYRAKHRERYLKNHREGEKARRRRRKDSNAAR
jgi:hypothetical protein